MVLSWKNAFLLGLKQETNTSFSARILSLGETFENKLYWMNLVIKIESLFGFEHANKTANIYTIITLAKMVVNIPKRSITKRYN